VVDEVNAAAFLLGSFGMLPGAFHDADRGSSINSYRGEGSGGGGRGGVSHAPVALEQASSSTLGTVAVSHRDRVSGGGGDAEDVAPGWLTYAGSGAGPQGLTGGELESLTSTPSMTTTSHTTTTLLWAMLPTTTSQPLLPTLPRLPPAPAPPQWSSPPLAPAPGNAATAAVAAAAEAAKDTASRASAALGSALPWLRDRASAAAGAVEGDLTPGTAPAGLGGTAGGGSAAVASRPAEHCGLVEVGVDYPGNDLLAYGEVVESQDECCTLCVQDLSCRAWTFHQDTGLCFLKGNEPRPVLSKVLCSSAISGQPTQVQRSIEARPPNSGTSLYCFSLALPWGYEMDLLRFQYGAGSGIFACDEYVVYSNITRQVGPGVVTALVPGSLSCVNGGEFGTALNNEIFLKVWSRVLADGRFALHDWTAKVDPDSVFLASRLRAVVVSRSEVTYFVELCSGDCKWGEDMFIDQCLSKVLKVRREFDSNILVEDHCAPPPGWQSCTEQGIVAFHPFKTVSGYAQCLFGTRNR